MACRLVISQILQQRFFFQCSLAGLNPKYSSYLHRWYLQRLKAKRLRKTLLLRGMARGLCVTVLHTGLEPGTTSSVMHS